MSLLFVYMKLAWSGSGVTQGTSLKTNLVGNLLPSKEYAIFMAAQNKFGSSLPSPEFEVARMSAGEVSYFEYL